MDRPEDFLYFLPQPYQQLQDSVPCEAGLSLVDEEEHDDEGECENDGGEEGVEERHDGVKGMLLFSCCPCGRGDTLG